MKAPLIIWIVLSICIHTFAVVPWLFGAEIGNPKIKGAHLDFWRKFGETDKRYLQNDNLIISLEGMMVFFDLPLCLLWLLLVLTSRRSQYVVQLIVSCFQFFGTVVYFIGAYLKQWKDISPSDFYGGFVGPNAIWILVPVFLILHASFKLQQLPQSPKMKSQ